MESSTASGSAAQSGLRGFASEGRDSAGTSDSVGRRARAARTNELGHAERRRRNIDKLKGATTIQQHVMDAPDTDLHDLRKKDAPSAGDWLRTSLNLAGVDQDASEEAIVASVVRGCASRGKVRKLASLHREGLWDPHKDRTAIEAADEGGYLLDLMMNFSVKMSWYPSAAEEHEEAVKKELSTAPVVEDTNIALNPLESPLTRQACLLANFLLVNSSVAKEVLQASAEEMVVFRGDDFEATRREKLNPFPESLDTLYVKRFIKEKDAKKMIYDPKNRTLQLPRLPGGPGTARTSEEMRLSVPMEYREDVLIPLTAEIFCFVYPTDELPFGGFLYLDLDVEPSNPPQPLVVNRLSHEPGMQAFSFGPPLLLNEDATKAIEGEVEPLTEDSPLRNADAVGFAWLPEKDLPGIGKLPFGGFAYVFNDQKKNRVFKLEAAGEVLRMADLSWDVSACTFTSLPKGEDLELNIAPRGEVKACPVSIMRVTTPGVLHPVMLHALAYTPREDALDTDVAKAISLAAFDRAWPLYCSQFCADILSAVSLTWITWSLRTHANAGDEEMWDWSSSNTVAYVLLCVVFVKNVFEEICLASGYWRCKWMQEYISYSNIVAWTSMSLVLTSIVLVPTRQNDQGYVRTTLGIAGWFKWIKIVTYLRGFMTLRLGMRILPILSAMQEGGSFILVMIFFIAASTHFFFALSHVEDQSYWEMCILVYNLGFLGDFNLDDFLGEEEASWAWVQYACFLLTSVLVMVSLTNIYIGVMGNAYDHNHDRATELFVRARAAISLNAALQSRFSWHCCGRRNKSALAGEYVWFCRAANEPGDLGGTDDGATSLRSVVRDMQQVLGTRMESLLGQVEEMREQPEARKKSSTHEGWV